MDIGQSCSQTSSRSVSGSRRGLGTRPASHPRCMIWEVDSSMLHITCDHCGKELRLGEDQRYVVKIEAYAAHDPAEITEADLDEDHMEALSQTLRELEENDAT